jgi:hypothetical protein
MRTRHAPWDYSKPRTVRKPADLNLCDICGNRAVDTPNGIRCLTCGNTNYVKVPEWLVNTVRCGLIMRQWEEAQYLAGLMPNIGGAMQINWEGQS